MDWHEIHILFAVGRTVAKISLNESEGAVGFLGCVGDMRSPFQVYREEDAKVGYVGDLLEDGLLRELKKVDFYFYTKYVAFLGTEWRPPSVYPCIEMFQLFLLWFWKVFLFLCVSVICDDLGGHNFREIIDVVEKLRGPSTVLWDTPESTLVASELAPFSTTHISIDLLVKDISHACRGPTFVEELLVRCSVKCL